MSANEESATLYGMFLKIRKSVPANNQSATETSCYWLIQIFLADKQNQSSTCLSSCLTTVRQSGLPHSYLPPATALHCTPGESCTKWEDSKQASFQIKQGGTNEAIKMNFLKNFAEKAKSVTDSPVRRVEDTSSPGSQQEGFICPLCISSFSSPEALQSHYEQSHAGDAELASNSPQSEKR